MPSPTSPSAGDTVVAARRPGRPRLVDAEERILDAALRIYSERGWYGTNMQEIARQAKVSKGLLYSRWSSAEEILEAAFDGVRRRPEPSSTGSFRDALIAECTANAELYLGPQGFAMIRLWVDGEFGPEFLRTVLENLNRRLVQGIRDRAHQAVKEGEIPADTDVTLLLDLIEGAVFAHINMTPSTKRNLLRPGLGAYIERLVDDQLRAAWEATSAPRTGPTEPSGHSPH